MTRPSLALSAGPLGPDKFLLDPIEPLVLIVEALQDPAESHQDRNDASDNDHSGGNRDGEDISYAGDHRYPTTARTLPVSVVGVASFTIVLSVNTPPAYAPCG